jgi:RNA polymerase sigma-70 factor (ECF subfamily)
MIMDPNSADAASPAVGRDSGDEADVIARLARRDQSAFEQLMRRHNARLYRVARAILRDDRDAEDALQDAYLDAYCHIGEFRGGARLATWLTRIVVNRALMRLRRQKRDRVVVPIREPEATVSDRGKPAMPDLENVADDKMESPSTVTLRAEVRRILERRLDQLPVAFRTVFVMRDVEDMTVEETAACLGIPEATVRTRLHRARRLLRESLAADLDTAAAGIFPFAGERCDRIVAAVLTRTANL